ncbi:hypothetical protein Tco_1278943, partial [Tanacetum coccineum]
LPQPSKSFPTSTGSKARVILPQLLGRKGITLLPELLPPAAGVSKDMKQ